MISSSRCFAIWVLASVAIALRIEPQRRTGGYVQRQPSGGTNSGGSGGQGGCGGGSSGGVGSQPLKGDFEGFMLQHGRSYGIGTEEYHMRKGIFHQRVCEIEQHNSQGHKWKAG